MNVYPSLLMIARVIASTQEHVSQVADEHRHPQQQ